MAQVTVTTLAAGPRNAIFHVWVEGDGTGDVAGEAIVDPATSFDPPRDATPTFRLYKVWYDLAGFNAALKFDYLTSDTPVLSMSGGQGSQLDFHEFGGLYDRSNPLDGTGKLELTTSGLGSGDFGSFVVYLKT